MASSTLNRWLIFTAILSIGVCQAISINSDFQDFEAPTSAVGAASDGVQQNFLTLSDLLRDETRRNLVVDSRSKRTCHGFPCMYSHLAEYAARRASMQTFLNMIRECANNPHCSPGRRRRRSPAASVFNLRLHHRTS